ncbi:PAS domain-containing sensor histidine kinase [Flavobacterium sp. NRK1]|uniref:PAS domain-containing sensor histidine kinase n=1 Tax=Flavobacterium sp. NRK1 TaxID=2954929 RepID=UPI002092FAC4|nr:PAS domain-containing sensor histidine kinase [Flavobacterium sp. NRK1]MCO6148895.1 ATP-binding protein [Flavobacterium sp. NRK1]
MEVVNTAPFPIGVYTGYEMKIVLANKSMIKTYGKGEDVLGKNYTELLPELENQAIFQQLRTVLSTGVPFEAKNARVDILVDGILKPHYFNYDFTPIFDQDGHVYGVMNTAAEVTALNISRLQTVEAEKKLRMAVESSQLGTFELDLSTGAVTASVRFFSLFIYKGDFFNLAKLTQNILEDDIPRWNSALASITVKGQMTCEVRLKIKDGLRWVRFSGALSEIPGRDDTLTGIAQDITEEKKHSAALSKLVEDRTRDLRRSNDDLRQFGHVLSHDLKEPVRKIAMFANRLREAINTGDISRQVQYTEKIQRCSHRTTDMVDAILLYSSSDREAIFEPVDLHLVMIAVLEDLELTIQEKKAKVTYEDLPVFRGSEILLYQLFYNLISNALKFTRSGTAPEVRIYTREDKNCLRLYVEDNGIGIDEQYFQKIFNTFERLHSKDMYEGTGLGLALCKKIVERHNGEIKAVNKQSSGALFEILMPLTA